MEKNPGDWSAAQTLKPTRFICGHCGRHVASALGWYAQPPAAWIFICPNCNRPTYFRIDPPERMPSVRFGDAVQHLTPEIEALYNEARDCMSVDAYTSAVLDCRKLLMSVAVHQGAGAGMTFLAYVEYLIKNNYAPAGSKDWIDSIRVHGNKATHELPMMTRDDAEQMLTFTGMLLKLVYEFPGRMKAVAPDPEEPPAPPAPGNRPNPKARVIRGK